MQCSVPLFDAVPLITVFVCVVLGQLLGRIKLGPIQLGGVCGALLVALLIGQTGCMVEGSLKDFAFALFIFAMGFSAGPQFVENLNLRGLRFGVLSIIEVVFVFGIVMIAVKFLGLDPGTAGGLAAGAATESAMVGTAIEALNRLGLDPEAFKALQANVVTAYTLTYVFGLITIVLFTNLLAPFAWHRSQAGQRTSGPRDGRRERCRCRCACRAGYRRPQLSGGAPRSHGGRA